MDISETRNMQRSYNVEICRLCLAFWKIGVQRSPLPADRYLAGYSSRLDTGCSGRVRRSQQLIRDEAYQLFQRRPPPELNPPFPRLAPPRTTTPGRRNANGLLA
ncbi:hypothetical protein EVAR_29678_1 [Eumeta japonica]|uniref:Uncharacterized protein n=1 Tax=Eumeta variegata TaxID=151549 RepID=A0A4C1WAA9_EUMVA|nr:hypothetical protein EVAR_29678_1 [Eumeta japonica]